jgi:hypothetical protein
LSACLSPAARRRRARHWLDGSEGGLWGLAIEFVLGCALAALSGWLLMRMKEE